MKSKIPLTSILIVATSVLCGCFGAGDMRQSNVAKVDMANVKVNIQLEREYVRNISSLGAGALVMYAALGPFSRNIIRLYGSVRQDTDRGLRTVGSFEKKLQWGTNNFNIKAAKNSEIFFKMRAGGTRSGLADVGSIKIGSEDNQMITMKLGPSGAEIY